jgi:hypothetical protein
LGDTFNGTLAAASSLLQFSVSFVVVGLARKQEEASSCMQNKENWKMLFRLPLYYLKKIQMGQII